MDFYSLHWDKQDRMRIAGSFGENIECQYPISMITPSGGTIYSLNYTNSEEETDTGLYHCPGETENPYDMRCFEE